MPEGPRWLLVQLLPAARGIGGAQPLIVFVRGQPALGERLVGAEQAAASRSASDARVRWPGGRQGGAGLGWLGVHVSSHQQRRPDPGERLILARQN